MKRLKIEVIEGVPKAVEILDCSLVEITAYVGAALGSVYSEMKQRDPAMGAAFKELVMAMTSEKSPMWNIDTSGVDKISIFVEGRGKKNGD